MNYSEKTDQLIPALFRARKAMSSGAKKNTENKHLHSSYANLESFIAATRPALEAEELMVIQSWKEGPDGRTIYLNTELMHISGQFMHEVSPFPIVKFDAHGVGSAITYARRYAMAAMFNIAQSDDDGNAAVKTSTDVVKSLRKAESLEALKVIMEPAKKYFENDKTAMRVINSAHNERRSEIIAGAGTFVTADKPAPVTHEDDEPQVAEQSAPQDISNF